MKKTIYISLAAFLGLLLSTLLHALIEMAYISWAFKQEVVLTAYFGGNCFLPPLITAGLAFLGLLAGLWLGFKWWDVVYIQRKHWRFQKKSDHKLKS